MSCNKVKICQTWSICSFDYTKTRRYRPKVQRQRATWISSTGCLFFVETFLVHSSILTACEENRKALDKMWKRFHPDVLRNVDLPVFAISLRCRKNSGVTKRTDTFVHEQYHVGISARFCFQLEVVNKKAKSSVLLRDDEKRWAPLRLCGFDNVHGKSPIYFLLLEFSYYGAAQYRTESIRRLSVCSSSIQGYTTLIERRARPTCFRSLWAC